MPSVKHSGGSVTVWGCISVSGVGAYDKEMMGGSTLLQGTVTLAAFTWPFISVPTLL